MPVTVRNYTLPIKFTYKGWKVTLYDASSFFQFSDVRVEVNISIDRMPYYSLLQKAIEHQKQQRQTWNYRRVSNNFSQDNKQLEQIFKAINDFFDTKRTIKYIEKANGGMIDRFLGQNLSGIEKIQQNVQSYIDLNLGVADVREELLAFLQQKGL